ncbi:barwin-like endoglucanase [Byssothecium circinans]|uniref:Barwin-like endoglucanase n=1 Tax=Byssothecium circinans TaxID=147558 RepID=A0A6A5TZ10_9PLEO|nr:barwin-like endoglucanase [Byssothecium circinans]
MMKSFSTILPFLGLALAQDHCGPRETVTASIVERVYVTVPAIESSSASAVADAHTTSHAVPHRPTYPFGNGTFSNSTRFPTYTPARPTTLQTQSTALASVSLVPSSSALTSSSSSKPVKTIIVSPVPVADATQSASAAPTTSVASSTSSSAAASAAPSTSPVEEGVSAAAVKGTATFYGGNIGGGHCSFTGLTLPSGVLGTAFGGNWDASACGQCVSVAGPNGNSIKAMVVDQCPECDVTHLDLFENAFTQLGSKSTGVLDVSYSVVPCGITSPIKLVNKSGTSAYFFSMQVVNSNVAVSKLEFSTDGGSSWKATTRQPYNFFELGGSAGSGASEVDVRITSVGGKTITVKGVSTADSATKTADGNFSS